MSPPLIRYAGYEVPTFKGVRTSERDAEIMRRYRRGEDVKAISDAVGLTVPSVDRIISKRKQEENRE